MTPRRDNGIGLPEVIIGLAVTLLAFAGFAALLANVAVGQRNTEAQLGAETLISQETAIAKTLPFDDIMLAPPGLTDAPSPCPLNGNTLKMSTQAITPTTTTVLNGVTYTITRSVTWRSTGQPVTCSANPNNYDDIKVLQYTVAWATSGNQPATRTATVYASAHTGQGTIPAGTT